MEEEAEKMQDRKGKEMENKIENAAVLMVK